MAYKKYWDEKRETMPSEQRKKIILERIKEQLHYVYNTLPFYRKYYDEKGFTPDDVKTLEDFTTKVPVIKKPMLFEDQQNNPPYGSYAGIQESENVRIHGSSGTSGRPTLYCYSKEDWDRICEFHAMAQWALGIRPHDVVQIAFPFSLFLGGWGVLIGVEKIGAAAFPIGAASSERHIELMYRVKSSVFTSTPSYALYLAEVAREMGYDTKESPIKIGAFGGETGAGIPSIKKALGDAWNIRVHDIATTSEMHPVWTNVECEAVQGTHCYTDEVYTEIVDKEDPNKPLSMGERGAIVYTHLWRKSQPMIRFWPGDESYMIDEPCPCGRTYPRLPEGVLGRLDDMLIIRGANVYPSAVENVIRSIPELGVEFRIIVEKKGYMDEASIQAEYHPFKVGPGLDPEQKARFLERLAMTASEKMKAHIGIRMPVKIVEPGTLERFTLKAKRVIDLR